MSTEFDKNILDWSHDCTDHKNDNDFFMELSGSDFAQHSRITKYIDMKYLDENSSLHLKNLFLLTATPIQCWLMNNDELNYVVRYCKKNLWKWLFGCFIVRRYMIFAV